MTNKPFDEWSRWYKFSELFEYYGPLDPSIKPTRTKNKISWKGKTGYLLTDNGFRLRSKKYRDLYSKIDLDPSLQDLPCLLDKTDIGVYWIKIVGKNLNRYDYIGEAGKQGIYKRLIDHFTKIAGTSKFSTGYRDTKEFRLMREYFDQKIKNLYTSELDFFKNHVQVSFVKIKNTSNASIIITKIEGMALQKFKANYNKFPQLNSQIETKGLDGMNRLF